MLEKHHKKRSKVNKAKKIGPLNGPPVHNQEVNVGRALGILSRQRGLSIRALAKKSGLAVNTLSLIKNNKTSPSVSTLQQLAAALEVPITAFFENGSSKSKVAYLKADERPGAAFAHGKLEDLSGGMEGLNAEPFVVTMKPNANSGSHSIVHTGHEFVFCLEGRIVYTIDDHAYLLEPGDSLLFESHLPHRWQNIDTQPARAILILCPLDERDNPTQRHFPPEVLKKSMNGT
jgi:transcriptional regulator with XRE-family HTH domain